MGRGTSAEVVIDVAKRRGVTEFLQVFEDVGATFFSLETDVCIVLDPVGNIERVNPAFEKDLGYTEADVRGKALIHLVSMENWAIFLRSFTATRQVPFGLLVKGGGVKRYELMACRFKARRGFLILRSTEALKYVR